VPAGGAWTAASVVRQSSADLRLPYTARHPPRRARPRRARGKRAAAIRDAARARPHADQVCGRLPARADRLLARARAPDAGRAGRGSAELQLAPTLRSPSAQLTGGGAKMGPRLAMRVQAGPGPRRSLRFSLALPPPPPATFRAGLPAAAAAPAATRPLLERKLFAGASRRGRRKRGHVTEAAGRRGDSCTQGRAARLLPLSRRPARPHRVLGRVAQSANRNPAGAPPQKPRPDRAAKCVFPTLHRPVSTRWSLSLVPELLVCSVVFGTMKCA